MCLNILNSRLLHSQKYYNVALRNTLNDISPQAILTPKNMYQVLKKESKKDKKFFWICYTTLLEPEINKVLSLVYVIKEEIFCIIFYWTSSLQKINLRELQNSFLSILLL